MNLDKLLALAELGRSKMRAPVGGKDWFRITNANDKAEVYIYDAIGEFGVTAKDFVAQLKATDTKNIDLHINSPGGLIFDAVAIYSALKNHSANVNTYIDGIAASAASFVAMAGDSITIEKPAKMMIHDANGLVIGNAKDMRDMANLLDELSNTIADIYADRTGKPSAFWRAAMQQETWYSSAEAVDAGLADRVANDSAPAPEDRRSQLIRARARAMALRG